MSKPKSSNDGRLRHCIWLSVIDSVDTDGFGMVQGSCPWKVVLESLSVRFLRPCRHSAFDPHGDWMIQTSGFVVE